MEPSKPLARKCQICESNELHKFLSLGHQPPSDGFLTEEKLNHSEAHYPLDLYFCENCKLVQLGYVVDPSMLFEETFIYTTGSSKELIDNFNSLVNEVVVRFGPFSEDLVVDIGSNDGTLLENYLPHNAKVLGIDPSKAAELATQKNILTLPKFFNEDTAKDVVRSHGRAKIITATNVFAHVKELYSFMNGIKFLLEDKGVFIQESGYLPDLLSKREYDAIYAEHLRYYSLKPLIHLFNKFGMDVFDVQKITTHGGSLRVFSCNKGEFPISENVSKLLKEEESLGYHSKEIYNDFTRKVLENRKNLRSILFDIKSKGGTIVGIGAPAKGNTLLNFCNIGDETIDLLLEKGNLKVGMHSPGMHIKVVEESVLFEEPQPTHALLLSWNLKDIIVPKLREKGFRGKIIVPVPEPYIMENSSSGKMGPKAMFGPWITDVERRMVADALTNESWYEKGNYYIEKFEKEFAEYHDRKYALMTPNCTSALHLLLLSLGIKEGDEVIVAECNWTATAAPITYCGSTPIFCDIDEKNWCSDPDSVEKNISDKTKAIIVTDLYGNMPDMDRLNEISKKYNIPLIEDAAEALGSTYKGVRAGKFGTGSVFSFHWTKTITTGEGGMLLLDDDQLFERARLLRNHGRPSGRSHDILEPTPKYIASNVQAALGYAQFTRLKELVDKKRWIFSQYKRNLSDVPDLQVNQDSGNVHNGAWSTSLVIGKSHNITNEELMNKIEEKGFPSRPFFFPLSSLSAYKKYQTGSAEKNPVAYDVAFRGITLPSALILTEQDIEEYCNAIKQSLKE